MSEILENIETPIEEEIYTPSNTLDGALELPQRVNDFCVISKFTWENGGRDIQTNSGWGENPYGEDYAIVPDEMVPAIKETQGFCDIVLNEDGSEVVSFTARDIPEITPEELGPTLEERVTTIEETLANEGTTGTDIWDEMAVAIEEGVNEV